ncbi:hypothetical protein KPH14_012347 [Odynerus spinipes]|uniref:Nicastrin n=1 Tax=Odynerus spinipes TaxID=1348599 RepID=A0AAD9RI51_9HYME|nr:hypothetical protein KPH14_012347 [Odynerus spinipes]
MARFLTWKYILLLIIIQFVTAKRIKDMIYMSIDGAAACFRRHNGTHQFGCSSSRSGSVGVIHLVEQEDDVRWLETNATAGPYTVVVPFSMFTRDTLIRLRNTNNINGVLLARNVSEEYPDFYSPEDTCPNRYSGYKKCNDKVPWNPYGSSILLEDWPFPMFYMQDETLLETIKSCFWTHNGQDLDKQTERSLCALEMKSFMFAAINSESCIKRSDFDLNIDLTLFCDPLGDRNIHWPLAPLNSYENSVIMVTARIDASSLFDGLSPGAQSAVTGMVTLLATAAYLNSLNPVVDRTNVVFTLLNGEAFDYIGSSRLVYDLKEGNFNALGGVNLMLSEITTVIELGQLSKGDLFLHVSNNKNNQMISKLREVLNATILDNSVPPTSIQSFLKTEPNLTTVVITNYNDQFINKYYNSILDDARSLHFNRNDTSSLASSLTKVTITLAEVLYYNVTGFTAPTGNVSWIEDLISEMLSCYLESAKCNLFHAASSPGTKLVDQVLPLYVSVHRVPNTATILTGQVLALLTGEKMLDMNKTTCNDNHLAWMGGYNFTGICINSTVNYSVALSPAFTISDYNMKSGVFSTWTESTWQMLSVRMFLKPSAATERLSMILGSIVTSTSFILVWFINTKADILFNSRRAVDR